MDAMDNLAKIYVKYYICQIHSSVCYLKYKKHKKTLENNLFFFSEHNINASEPNVHIEVPKSNTQYNMNYNEDIVMKNDDYNEVDEDEKEKYPKKLFVFKNKIFSRVEIQGIVVQIQTRGNDAAKERKIVYIDDTTGIIQCLIWKNKMPNSFDNIEKLFGVYIRVLGQVDYYQSKFEIIADRIQPITKVYNETLFHSTLLQNQKAIFEISINEINKKAFDDLDHNNSNTNNYNMITPSHSKNNSNSNINSNESTNFNSSNFKNDFQRMKIYDQSLKQFSNFLLAFCQSFKLEGGQDDKYGFTKVNVEKLMENGRVYEMLQDFSSGYDQVKFVTDAFNKVLEPNSLGKMIYGFDEGLSANYVEIKHDNTKIKNDICNFITNKYEEDSSKGATYNEIYQHILSLYNGVYNDVYVRFIIQKLSDEYAIISIAPNVYTIA